jgi:hypothetical protein
VSSLNIVLTILLVISVGINAFLLVGGSSAPNQISDSAIAPPVTGFIPVSSTLTPANTEKILNKQYVFSINNQAGTKLSEFKFLIKSIERTKEIDIAGGKATAVGGRELLIINIELTNPGNIPASVVARNYLRLKVNNQDKLLAPEYHSDPVDLQPQSTRDIRLGFNIAESDRNLILQVGELEGDKEQIAL